MRRKKWIHVDLCLVCFRVVEVTGAQRVRVEFENLRYVSRVICCRCSAVLDQRKELYVSSAGRTLKIRKRDQVGPHRIRGDGTWSCKGGWL